MPALMPDNPRRRQFRPMIDPATRSPVTTVTTSSTNVGDRRQARAVIHASVFAHSSAQRTAHYLELRFCISPLALVCLWKVHYIGRFGGKYPRGGGWEVKRYTPQCRYYSVFHRFLQ